MAMMKATGITKDFSAREQLFFAIFLMVICMIASGVLITFFKYLGNIESDDITKYSARHIVIFRYIQMSSTLISFGLPAVLFGLFYTNNIKKYFAVVPPQDMRWYLLAPVLLLSILPIIKSLSDINKGIHLPASMIDIEQALRSLEHKLMQYVLVFLKDKSPITFAVNVFMIALLPAICEELFFRGVVQRIAYQVFDNFHAAILFAAAIFAAIHVEFFSFLPLFALGILLGYLYYYSGSLLLPMAFHFINNAFTVTAIYIMVLKNQDVSLDGSSYPWYMMALSVIFFVSTFSFFVHAAQHFKQKHKNHI